VSSLDSAWLKINRGREHVEAVEEAVDDRLGTDAYTISREIDPKTSYTVRRAQIKEAPPTRISILIGDAVRNLRSALDHAVYALAESQLGTLSSEVEEGLMFPIVGNQNRKGQRSDGRILGRDPVGADPTAGRVDDAGSHGSAVEPRRGACSRRITLARPLPRRDVGRVARGGTTRQRSARCLAGNSAGGAAHAARICSRSRARDRKQRLRRLRGCELETQRPAVRRAIPPAPA
jgi:hypothetical protein